MRSSLAETIIRPRMLQLRRKSCQVAVVDYSAAVTKAIEWLGDRYLLAKPLNATLSRALLRSSASSLAKGPESQRAAAGATSQGVAG